MGLTWGRMGFRAQGGCLSGVGGVSRVVYWDWGSILFKIVNAGPDGSRCKRGQNYIFCIISINEMIIMNMFLSTR